MSTRRHLSRLSTVWIEPPICFITTASYRRRAILAAPDVAAILIEELRTAHKRHGWLVGRYVIMLNHVHFFCVGEREAKPLSKFVGLWKSWTSRRIHQLASRPSKKENAIWQPEFFDHVIRSDESYDEKWNYVRENPVRAGLTSRADDWPFAGGNAILQR